MPDPTPVAVGWTATATIQTIQTIIVALVGGGGLYGIARAIALLWRMANDRARQDNEAAQAVRREMMEMNDKLQKRVDDLERIAREERRLHSEEMDLLRKNHAEETLAIRSHYEKEIRAMRDEIGGLHRQMLQMQETSQAAIVLGPKAPTASGRKADEIGIGGTLRRAYPPVDDDAS